MLKCTLCYVSVNANVQEAWAKKFNVPLERYWKIELKAGAMLKTIVGGVQIPQFATKNENIIIYHQSLK